MRPKSKTDSIEEIMKREIETELDKTNIFSTQKPPKFINASQINEKRTSFTIPRKKKDSEKINVLNPSETEEIKTRNDMKNDTENEIKQTQISSQKEPVVNDTNSLDIDVEWS